jgi:hypothetical protein
MYLMDEITIHELVFIIFYLCLCGFWSPAPKNADKQSVVVLLSIHMVAG